MNPTSVLKIISSFQLNPAWKIKERLASEIRISMQDDSGCCCSPLNEEVQKPFEIEEMFNRVTVYKGMQRVRLINLSFLLVLYIITLCFK